MPGADHLQPGGAGRRDRGADARRAAEQDHQARHAVRRRHSHPRQGNAEPADQPAWPDARRRTWRTARGPSGRYPAQPDQATTRTVPRAGRDRQETRVARAQIVLRQAARPVHADRQRQEGGASLSMSDDRKDDDTATAEAPITPEELASLRKRAAERDEYLDIARSEE